MTHRFPPPKMRFPPPMSTAFQHNIPGPRAPFFPAAPPPRLSMSDRQADEAWLNEFLRNAGKTLRVPVPRVKVHEAVEAIDACAATLSQLEQLERDLAAVIETSSEQEWQAKWTAVKSQQSALAESLPALPADAALPALKAALARRKQRRLQGRRRRKRQAQESLAAALARQRKHAAADALLAGRREEAESARRGEELAGQAALVLEDTSRRQNEARRERGRVCGLLRLRELRAGAAAARGEATGGGAAFEAAARSLASAWDAQLRQYDVEEAGLRLMLNHESAPAPSAQRRPPSAEWRRALFGAPRRPDPQYVAADNDLDAFVACRRDWDQFVVDAATPISSCIPIGWVLPAPPSSSEWAELLSAA